MDPTGVAGLGVVIIAVIGLAKFLLGDRTVAMSNAQHISELREDITTLERKVEALEHDLDEQRTMKHALKNELTKALLVISFIKSSTPHCTCGVLDRVRPLIESFDTSAVDHTDGDDPLR